MDVEAVPEGGATIDELARLADTTSRNVRAYQERGLLEPPRKVGRTGFYDGEHLLRLRLIARLLDDGFSLAAIGTLLEAWDNGASLGSVLGFEEALTAPFLTEQSVELGPEVVAELLPSEPSEGDQALTDAVAAGLIAVLDDGTLRIASPLVLQLGETLRAFGVPTGAMAEELLRLRHDADVIADRFLALFLTHVWQPYLEAGAPPEGLERMTEAFELTRPIPAQATAAMVALAMRDALDAIADDLLAIADRTP